MTTTRIETNVLPSHAGKSDDSANQVALSPWKWCAVTCVLLGISGGVRFWRDRQFATIAQESEACPFRLSELPTVLGTWQAVEGSESTLDPEIVRFAGASDHVLRSYRDSGTGETVSVLLLYGLAVKVHSHVPELCYPAAGYTTVNEPVDHDITLSGSEIPVRYRSSYFVKRVGGLSKYMESIYTFGHNDAWLPETASRWKTFRYHPGMFKIQIDRNTSGITTSVSPGEFLIREIVRYINNRVGKRNAALVNDLPLAHTPAK